MSISAEKFGIAVQRLYDEWSELEGRSDWEQVQILTSYGTSYLRITRSLPAQDSGYDSSSSNAEIAVDEDDQEALPHPQSSRSAEPQVIYDIVHSTSYQVPVVYLTIKGASSGGRRPSLDEAYELLVPAVHRPQIESVGVMGALSMAEHPVTGTPAYFIHPCRTQEAMSPLVAEGEVKPDHYLLLWLGLVGGSVGLHVPIELAQEMAGPSETSREAGA